MKLSDLSLGGGQAFLASLADARLERPLGLEKRKRYRGALRSFSRFLHKANLVDEDLFFPLSTG
jgi:hypothetical protein